MSLSCSLFKVQLSHQVINVSTEFPKHSQACKILDSHSDDDEQVHSLLGYNAMSFAKYLPLSQSRSSETSSTIYQSIWHHIPENLKLSYPNLHLPNYWLDDGN